MLDMQLFIMLKGIIEAAEPDFSIPKVNGLPGILVAQNYQPTQQGVATRPTAFLEIIGHQRIGQPRREDYFDADTSTEIHKETQKMITKFQLSALVKQDADSLTQLTAADVVNLIGMILQNSQTIEQIEAQGCGMLLEKDTRNPKFLDDYNRFEANPSLDFGITHDLIVTRSQNVLQSTELDIYVI